MLNAKVVDTIFIFSDLSNWVDDSYDPILPGITKLTSAITNLTMRNEDEAEQWQVENRF